MEDRRQEFPRGVPPWRSCQELWLIGPPRSWGPVFTDARRLWSPKVMSVVASRVGAPITDVAGKLLADKASARGRYLLLGTIARTRGCTVFAAVDQLLAREVALKVHHDSDDETTWRLLAEVQAMTRFDHPNILRVHDVGDHDGWLYSVMDLCDCDLLAWKGGEAWSEVLDRLLEVGRGLSLVHAAGLVHGDVKPANVLVKDGVAKLGDFGLVTTPGWSGRVVGTPGFIAPEVADGRRGHEGDLFAFACCAWTCLFGGPPFGEPPPGADVSAATMVLVERAREGQFNEGEAPSSVSPTVTATLRPALRSDPAERPTLDQLLGQLSALRSARVPTRWRWWPRR
ncbi:putative serine/threonine protein kinase [Enhygromyxa salina]|uniref:Putative serine/threonine protein kinase n=1 Tax=Enhygromyxa salina TaxID=215803 RepID=A0A0C2D8J1_9BACT|nr:putative serine/threonine protein kinase [Enhygromyxa salina]